MEMKTFTVYPFDGKAFSIESANLNVEQGTLKLYSNPEQALAFLANERIAAIYHPNEPPIDWRLTTNQDFLKST